MHRKPVQRFEMAVMFAQGPGSQNIIHKSFLLIVDACSLPHMSKESSQEKGKERVKIPHSLSCLNDYEDFTAVWFLANC